MRVLRLLISAIVFVVVGIVFVAGGISDKISSRTKTDISTLTEDKIKDGMMVEGTIYEIWDEFAYDSGDGDYTGYYAFPLEATFEGREPYFVALKLSNAADLKIAEKMSNETDDYYYNDITPNVWTEFEFTGKVRKLRGDGLEFFREYVEQMGYDDADYDKAYVISRYTAGSETGRIVIGVIFAGLGLLMIGGTVLLRLVKGRR